MVETDVMGSLLSGFSSVSGSIYDLLMYIVILGVIAGLGYFIYFLSKHNIKVRVRTITGGKDSVIDDKARVIKEDGIIKWKLLKLKAIIIPAPPDAISIDNRGKPVAECYYTIDGNFEFIDATTPKIMRGENYTNSFKPLNTRQRGIAVSQTIKALSRKKNNWKDNIVAIAGLGACVIIVISMFIFWENITKPNLQMAEQSQNMFTLFEKITTNQAEITHRQGEIMRELNIQVKESKGLGEPPD